MGEMTHRIYIDAVRYVPTGTIYDASFQVHGRVHTALKGVRDPITQGAREMAILGLTGAVELWDRKLPYPRCRGDIERLARISVLESEKRSLRIVPYVPFRKGDDE